MQVIWAVADQLERLALVTVTSQEVLEVNWSLFKAAWPVPPVVKKPQPTAFPVGQLTETVFVGVRFDALVAVF